MYFTLHGGGVTAARDSVSVPHSRSVKYVIGMMTRVIFTFIVCLTTI
jgi:hypothetical protein